MLARNKTPLSRQPLLGPLGRHGFPPLSGNPAFAYFVAAEALPSAQALRVNPDSVVAAHALDYWLTEE